MADRPLHDPTHVHRIEVRLTCGDSVQRAIREGTDAHLAEWLKLVVKALEEEK